MYTGRWIDHSVFLLFEITSIAYRYGLMSILTQIILKCSQNDDPVSSYSGIGDERNMIYLKFKLP